MNATKDTDLIWYIRNCVRGFHIMQNPRSTPLRDEFPTKDTILSEVHVGSKNISACSVLCQKRHNQQMFGRNKQKEEENHH